MYYAGEIYRDGSFEPGSLKLEDMKYKWRRKQEFESLIIPFIMSDDLELHIYEVVSDKSFDISIMPNGENEHLRFDLKYTSNGNYHEFFCQDLLLPDGKKLSKRLNANQMFQVLKNYHSSGKVRI